MSSQSSPENNRPLVEILARLLAMFPVQGQTADGQRLRLAGYVEALGVFPLAAVRHVAGAAMRGEYETLNRTFAPTSAELADLIRAHVAREAKVRELRAARPAMQSVLPPAIAVMPKPRSADELRALPPGSRITWEEMLIRGGRSIGRFETPKGPGR